MLLFTAHTQESERALLACLDYYQPGSPHRGLEEELRSNGVTIPPQEHFYRHRAQLLEPYRRGKGRYLWPLGVLIERSKVLCVLVCLLCGIAVYAAGLGLYHNGIWTLGFGIGIGVLACPCVYSAYHHGAYWRSIDLFGSAHERSVPYPLIRRAEAAREIQNATVRLEIFKDDPLIVVLRGAEKVYIGAWNTGNKNLDYDA